ncbi:MAG: hypothetical protein ACLQU1_02645 [Bryobacteraceae bacterium]
MEYHFEWKHLVLFLRALGREGVVLLTGGAIIAVLESWSLMGHTLDQRVAWLILGLMFMLASFRAWDREHGAKENEIKCKAEVQEELDSFNAKVDLRGCVYVLVEDRNPLADQSRDASRFRFQIDCTNHGGGMREISKVRLAVVPPNGPFWTGIQRIGEPKSTAYGQQLLIPESHAIVDGISPQVLKQSTITLYLVDSMGTEYSGIETKPW